MLSKSQLKLITSLAKKKYRNQHQLFVVEGVKSIKEFLNSEYKLKFLLSTAEDVFEVEHSKFNLITELELKKISYLSTPNKALAIFEKKEPKPIETNHLILALDNISDPGNLGTIIRLCDWFGITDLVCNLKTVDCFNPKVVQASMGSLSRLNITYLNLEIFLKEQPQLPVYGTFMDGENIYTTRVNQNGIVILGNEANGISKSIELLVSKKLSIPQFGTIQETESLNVATAASIVLSEFKRRTIET